MQVASLPFQVRHLLDNHKFGKAFSLTIDMAGHYGLYDLFAKSFDTLRVLAFQDRDWEQAGFGLERIAAKLEREISVIDGRGRRK